MKNQKLVITGVIALVVGIGIGYFGSTSLGATKSPTRMGNAAFTTRGAMMGGNFAGRNGAMGGLLTGTVASKDAGSLTIDTRDGSSHVVLVTPNTAVSKSVNGSLTDVASGSTVIVSGSTNSDGSISANLIQLRPAMTPAAPAAQ